jgi:hypothetical protein
MESDKVSKFSLRVESFDFTIGKRTHYIREDHLRNLKRDDDFCIKFWNFQSFFFLSKEKKEDLETWIKNRRELPRDDELNTQSLSSSRGSSLIRQNEFYICSSLVDKEHAEIIYYSDIYLLGCYQLKDHKKVLMIFQDPSHKYLQLGIYSFEKNKVCILDQRKKIFLPFKRFSRVSFLEDGRLLMLTDLIGYYWLRLSENYQFVCQESDYNYFSALIPGDDILVATGFANHRLSLVIYSCSSEILLRYDAVYEAEDLQQLSPPREKKSEFKSIQYQQSHCEKPDSIKLPQLGDRQMFSGRNADNTFWILICTKIGKASVFIIKDGKLVKLWSFCKFVVQKRLCMNCFLLTSTLIFSANTMTLIPISFELHQLLSSAQMYPSKTTHPQRSTFVDALMFEPIENRFAIVSLNSLLPTGITHLSWISSRLTYWFQNLLSKEPLAELVSRYAEEFYQFEINKIERDQLAFERNCNVVYSWKKAASLNDPYAFFYEVPNEYVLKELCDISPQTFKTTKHDEEMIIPLRNLTSDHYDKLLDMKSDFNLKTLALIWQDAYAYRFEKVKNLIVQNLISTELITKETNLVVDTLNTQLKYHKDLS